MSDSGMIKVEHNLHTPSFVDISEEHAQRLARALFAYLISRLRRCASDVCHSLTIVQTTDHKNRLVFAFSVPQKDCVDCIDFLEQRPLELLALLDSSPLSIGLLYVIRSVKSNGGEALVEHSDGHLKLTLIFG